MGLVTSKKVVGEKGGSPAAAVVATEICSSSEVVSLDLWGWAPEILKWKVRERKRRRRRRGDVAAIRSAAMSPVHLMVMSRRVQHKLVMTVRCCAR
ncbi:hypothetical protein GW17_00049695 [Ensete ventricosum]|nr:hypothetical protein GW17_00049695 [Ensete ventricosum]